MTRGWTRFAAGMKAEDSRAVPLAPAVIDNAGVPPLRVPLLGFALTLSCADPCPTYQLGWEAGREHGAECAGTELPDGSVDYVMWTDADAPEDCDGSDANRGYYRGYCQAEYDRIRAGESGCGALGDVACARAYGGVDP